MRGSAAETTLNPVLKLKLSLNAREEKILNIRINYSNPCSSQMTKRKAIDNIDEWLNERRAVSEVPIPTPELPSEPCITIPPPTAEASQLQVTSGLATDSSTGVEITEEMAAE